MPSTKRESETSGCSLSMVPRRISSLISLPNASKSSAFPGTARKSPSSAATMNPMLSSSATPPGSGKDLLVSLAEFLGTTWQARTGLIAGLQPLREIGAHQGDRQECLAYQENGGFTKSG